jgi:hypothetical protein
MTQLMVLRAPKPAGSKADFRPPNEYELNALAVHERLGWTTPTPDPAAPEPSSTAFALTLLSLPLAWMLGGFWFGLVVLGLGIDYWRTTSRTTRYALALQNHADVLERLAASRSRLEVAVAAEQLRTPVDDTERQACLETWYRKYLAGWGMNLQYGDTISNSRDQGYVTQYEDSLATALSPLLPTWQQVYARFRGSCPAYTADIVVVHPVTGAIWVIEVDGRHHGNDPAQVTRDEVREKGLREQGISVIRVANSEVEYGAATVAAAVLKEVDATRLLQTTAGLQVEYVADTTRPVHSSREVFDLTKLLDSPGMLGSDLADVVGHVTSLQGQGTGAPASTLFGAMNNAAGNFHTSQERPAR